MYFFLVYCSTGSEGGGGGGDQISHRDKRSVAAAAAAAGGSFSIRGLSLSSTYCFPRHVCIFSSVSFARRARRAVRFFSREMEDDDVSWIRQAGGWLIINELVFGRDVGRVYGKVKGIYRSWLYTELRGIRRKYKWHHYPWQRVSVQFKELPEWFNRRTQEREG